MGSSKKHKEKDREHKRKKHKRSRSRSRSREKKTRRHHSPEQQRPERVESYREERDRYSGDVDHDYRDRPPPPQKAEQEELGDADFGGREKLSLSIEETNKLRAKLGLKPLELPGSNDDSSKSAENQDVHVPAINLSEKQRTEKIRERTKTMQEKRKVSKKLSTIKGLAESDADDENASSWVKKSRQLQKDKEMAKKRAKVLEEMDAEFGVASLVEQELAAEKQSKYSSRDLSGLKVEHDIEKFREGANVILTLKDKGVLDEEEDDVLVNVNIIDEERAEKNVENKKMNPEYKPYDEPEMDEYGMMKVKEVLDKYDEEIHGEKKESFVLGSGGKYNAENERNMNRIRQQLRQQGQTLTGPGLTLASEFLTPEEMAAQTRFKKIKKKVRRIRKKEILKADDLLQLPDQVAESTDYGSRSRGRGVIIKEEEPMDAAGPSSEGQAASLDEDVAFYTGILPPKLESATAQPPLPSLPPLPQPGQPFFGDNDDDVIGPDEDLSGLAVEEELLQQELQASLSMTRRLQQKQQRKLGMQKMFETMEHDEDADAKLENFNSLGTANIILNSTSEFCRSLGEIPTYGLSGNREEEREDIMDEELELMEQRRHAQEMEEQASGWAEVDIDTNPVNIVGEEKAVLEEEPIVTESIGSALKLAMKKGYLEGEGLQKGTTALKHSYLQAQNYSIEDKRYDDLDEKYRKRDRYGGGMITDFKDKDGYKPEIMLEYVDDNGRPLNPKEAFRQLSHRFHGKGSGKKKTEKRQKKVEEEQLMKHMSSSDTPLNTLSMLKAKQLQEKSPYVILSGNKTFSSNSTTLSKQRH